MKNFTTVATGLLMLFTSITKAYNPSFEKDLTLIKSDGKSLSVSNPAIVASISCAQNGDWNDPNTWSPNLVPTINDDVTIGMGLTVTLSGTMNARSIMVMGTLKPTTLSTSFDLTTEGIMVGGIHHRNECPGLYW